MVLVCNLCKGVHNVCRMRCVYCAANGIKAAQCIRFALTSIEQWPNGTLLALYLTRAMLIIRIQLDLQTNCNLCTHTHKEGPWISYALSKLKSATKIRHIGDSTLSIAANNVFQFRFIKSNLADEIAKVAIDWIVERKKYMEIKMLKLIWVFGLCCCDTSSITQSVDENKNHNHKHNEIDHQIWNKNKPFDKINNKKTKIYHQWIWL